MEGYIIFVSLLLLLTLIRNSRSQLIYAFLVITVFSAIRYGIGYDYFSYLGLATRGETSVSIELIPRLLLDLSSQTIPFLFFIISSIFISIFYYKGIEIGGKDYMLEVFFYVSFPFLFMNQLGIVRQGMATSLVFCAIAMKNDKLYKRILLLFFAFLCHRSAVVGFFILFPWNKVSLQSLWVILILGFSFGFLLIPITQAIVDTGFLGEVGTNKASGYLATESSGEGNLMKYLIYFIAILTLIYYHKLVRLDAINLYYIGLIVFGVFLFALFSFNMTIGKRFSMFFFSAAIFVVPQIVRVMKLPYQIYLLLCVLLFSLTVYIGSNNVREEDDPGCAVTYPYRTIFNFID